MSIRCIPTPVAGCSNAARERLQYDVLGQVTNGWKYDANGNEITDHKYAYLFDDIGNRDRTITNTVTSDYTANRLNQYTTRVTSGNTETFYYDADGNLTNDGHWEYQWDAENRLIVMATLPSVTPEKRLEFDYDWRSRRVRKRVWNDRDGNGDPVTNLRFIYDGWNLLAEVGASGSLVRSYLWGTDLSGTEQGAGGVGGLLALSTLNPQLSTHFPAYDGNGNLMALADASTGQFSAQYEHGPFGETLSASGTMATANPFRFSTKFQDDETGLLYYGYRYYDPPSGRWVSRDPIEERGGPNFYDFVANRPAILIDLDGRIWTALDAARGPRPPLFPIPPSFPIPPPTPSGADPLDLFLMWLLRNGDKAFQGYSDGVWAGILAAPEVEDYITRTEEDVKNYNKCCSQSAFIREQENLVNRMSFFSIFNPRTYEAGVAVSTGTLRVGKTSVSVECDSSVCAWIAAMPFTVKDKYSFESFDKDGKHLPVYYPDSNVLFRILFYLSPVAVWGKDFDIEDTRVVECRGSMPCAK